MQRSYAANNECFTLVSVSWQEEEEEEEEEEEKIYFTQLGFWKWKDAYG